MQFDSSSNGIWLKREPAYSDKELRKTASFDVTFEDAENTLKQQKILALTHTNLSEKVHCGTNFRFW